MLSKAMVALAYQAKATAIARLGVDLTVVVPPFWRDGTVIQRLERTTGEGFRLVVWPVRLAGHFHLHWYPGLGRLLAAVRPDLLHIDEEPYNLATVLALQAGLAVGATCLFFTWQNIFKRYPPPFGWFERRVLSRAAGAIAGNRAAAGVLARKGFRGPVVVVPQFGVDLTLFRPRPPRRPGEPFVIGYIGRLVPQKGVSDLLQAVLGLRGDWRLVFLGEGQERAALARRAATAGVSERVTFLPWVPSRAVADHLRRFDVLVLPSRSTPRWQEQFGRVLVEAMACGVPVVGSSSGEIPHVIGEAGLVYPEGDCAALRACLERLWADHDLWQACAQRGLERASAFAHERIAEQTVAFYRQLRESSCPAPRE
jgi:glycosyltransferase involved in cell wall biosynthesis